MNPNGWTVAAVFDIPQIIQVLPEYDGQQNVKVIPIDVFFNRIFQLGVNNITQLEAACISQVLGRQNIEFAIIFSEIEMILQGLGVQEVYEELLTEDSMPEEQRKILQQIQGN